MGTVFDNSFVFFFLSWFCPLFGVYVVVVFFEMQYQQHTLDDMSQSLENHVNTTEPGQNDGSSPNELENVNIFEQLPSQVAQTPTPSNASVFMKIRLRESDDLLLFENNSYTVLRDTVSDDAAATTTTKTALSTQAETETEAAGITTVMPTTTAVATASSSSLTTAQAYDEKLDVRLMMDKEKHRKTNNVETQTVDAHYKTRAINTNHIEKSMAGTFVSLYDMHDTYTNLERTTQCIQIDYDDRHEQLDITTYTRDGQSDLSEALETSKSFQLSSMILQRVLASNVFHEHQRRFRSMHSPNSLEPVVNYLYRLQFLYRYRYHETSGNAVSCMSWCPKNTDILAIGYGVFKYQACRERERSAVCLWNIKVEFFYKNLYIHISFCFSENYMHICKYKYTFPHLGNYVHSALECIRLVGKVFEINWRRF